MLSAEREILTQPKILLTRRGDQPKAHTFPKRIDISKQHMPLFAAQCHSRVLKCASRVGGSCAAVISVPGDHSLVIAAGFRGWPPEPAQYSALGDMHGYAVTDADGGGADRALLLLPAAAARRRHRRPRRRQGQRADP